MHLDIQEGHVPIQRLIAPRYQIDKLKYVVYIYYVDLYGLSI